MQTAPQPRKGFQNLGFDGVLSPLSFAEERKGAAGGTAQRMRIATPVRFAMTGFGKYRLKTPAEFSTFS